jgi:hypothetical protein
MTPNTMRLLRRHAAVYLGLAATGAVIGWNRARPTPGAPGRGRRS